MEKTEHTAEPTQRAWRSRLGYLSRNVRMLNPGHEIIAPILVFGAATVAATMWQQAIGAAVGTIGAYLTGRKALDQVADRATTIGLNSRRKSPPKPTVSPNSKLFVGFVGDYIAKQLGGEELRQELGRRLGAEVAVLSTSAEVESDSGDLRAQVGGLESAMRERHPGERLDCAVLILSPTDITERRGLNRRKLRAAMSKFSYLGKDRKGPVAGTEMVVVQPSAFKRVNSPQFPALKVVSGRYQWRARGQRKNVRLEVEGYNNDGGYVTGKPDPLLPKTTKATLIDGKGVPISFDDKRGWHLDPETREARIQALADVIEPILRRRLAERNLLGAMEQGLVALPESKQIGLGSPLPEALTRSKRLQAGIRQLFNGNAETHPNGLSGSKSTRSVVSPG